MQTKTDCSVTAPPLGAHAKRVLAKLGMGHRGSTDAQGNGRIGTLTVPAMLLSRLARADLIALKDEAFSITGPGERWLMRANARKGEDGAHAQNRILVRQARETPEGRQMAQVNLGDNPLAWLMRRKLISPSQFEASQRLRHDHELAQRGPAVTMRWDAPPMSRTARGAPDALDPTLAQIAAKRRLERAFTLAGPGLADVLDKVVCQGSGIEAAERLLGWPPRSAKLVLSFALDRVAGAYGLSPAT